MLKKQLWAAYSKNLSAEWRESWNEGKDVAEYKDICELISQKEPTDELKALSIEIAKILQAAQCRTDYPYCEPSVLNEICQERPTKRHDFVMTLTDVELKERLAGAWIGRISGCLLGKPVECMKSNTLIPLLKDTDNYPMHKYIMKKDFTEATRGILNGWANECWADNVHGAAPVDDDTNYTVFAMKLIEQYGRDFCPDDVLDAWLSWIPMFSTCTAEHIAYRNAAMGMTAPATALYLNPYREWIGAQIRGDFFGYINPGNAEKAAEFAWRDASISHIKNGIYGEMFIAAMIASAFASDNIPTIVEAGLDVIPKKCRLRHDIDLVLQWHHDEISAEDAIAKIHALYDENDAHDWCYTNSNAMIVVMALLYGNKDFGKTVSLAVQSAFDTDCNGATAGSVLGAMIGAKAIPECWYECYDKQLYTTIEGYNHVTVEQLVQKTFELVVQ